MILIKVGFSMNFYHTHTTPKNSTTPVLHQYLDLLIQILHGQLKPPTTQEETEIFVDLIAKVRSNEVNYMSNEGYFRVNQRSRSKIYGNLPV